MKEIIMSTVIRSALIAVVLLTSISGASASTSGHGSARAIYNTYWTDKSDPYDGFDANSSQGNRAFWDYQSQHGH
jgi:hypothetical protein